MTIIDLFSEMTGFWLLIGVSLVFFMQAGFAMVETGFTRAKNAGNIIMKNLMDFAIGALAFWLLGFGLLCGDSLSGIIGKPFNPFTDFAAGTDWTSFIFNLVFCATAATIVSGAMAERTKFSAYCIYSLLISMLVYPVSAHWIWNANGWLASLGFVDFAGSTAVHLVGGVSAFVGAKILGPRLGKYKKGEDGKLVSKAIPGHSLTLGALGVFILWFGWYGFNGAAATSVDMAAKIFVTTSIAAATSTIAVMIITWIKYKKPDVSMTLNGTLAGLVAITAGCAAVSTTGAFFIGLIAAFVVVFGIEFIDKKLHIDDPVGAIGVHGLCGAVGTILVGLFSTDSGIISGFILNSDLTAAAAFKFLGVQVLGVAAVICYVAAVMFAVFKVIQKVHGLRVSKHEEIVGLDLTEHGLNSSYADFMPNVSSNDFVDEETIKKDAPVAIEEALPIQTISRTITKGTPKLTKLVIVTRPEKLNLLKEALDEIGITGMTITNVVGCGMQKGSANYYRGVKVDVQLLPKVKVEVVVTKVPVQTVIDTAKKALYTGNYGDGKIFVYDVENVIKVRTGEMGYAALQDED